MHSIIKKIVKKRGSEIICSNILINCIDDEGGFSDVEMRPYKKILKGIVADGYSQKLLDIGAWNAETETLARTYAQKNMLQEEGVLYAFSCLAYGLGWLAKAPKKQSVTSSTLPQPTIPQPMVSTNTQTPPKPQVKTKPIQSEETKMRRLIETGTLSRSGIKVDGHFVIPNGTNRIGPKTFYECEKLVSVEIPPSVKRIGENAFYHCKQLASVVIPEGVQSIGKRAFYCCTNLTSVEIPASVTKIEDEAFYLCRKLETIMVPNGKIMAFRKMCPRDSGRPKNAQIIEKQAGNSSQQTQSANATSLEQRIKAAEKRALEAEKKAKRAEEDRIKAEEAARQREIARQKAAHEAQQKAEEEAQRKADELAQLMAKRHKEKTRQQNVKGLKTFIGVCLIATWILLLIANVIVSYFLTSSWFNCIFAGIATFFAFYGVMSAESKVDDEHPIDTESPTAGTIAHIIWRIIWVLSLSIICEILLLVLFGWWGVI